MFLGSCSGAGCFWMLLVSWKRGFIRVQLPFLEELASLGSGVTPGVLHSTAGPGKFGRVQQGFDKVTLAN